MFAKKKIHIVSTWWRVEIFRRFLVYKSPHTPPTDHQQTRKILPVLNFWSFPRVLMMLVVLILFCNVYVSPFTAVMLQWLTSQLCQLLHVQAQGVFGLFRHVTPIKSSSCQHYLPLLIRLGTQKRDGWGGTWTIEAIQYARSMLRVETCMHTSRRTLSCLYSVKFEYWIV